MQADFETDRQAPASAGEILVVEDTLASLRLLSDILAGAGYSVRQAQDGEMAMLTVRATRPELILLDISMPIMDGYEVCRTLKADPATRDIPVIFLSALHDTPDKLKGFAVGAVDFIAKPYHAEEVLVRVQTQLELGRLRAALEARVQQRTADLTATMRALEDEVALRRKAEAGLMLAARVFDATFDGIMVTDHRGLIVSVNPAFTRITGYAKEEVVGQSPRLLKSGRHDRSFYEDVWETVSSTGSWTGEVWNRRKDGNVVPMLETITHTREGQNPHYISTLKDLSESKDAETLINFLAYHDALTGLPNRLLAHSHFEQVLAAGKGQGIAVMCFGIDRFRTINDSLGHAAGDQVLKTLASRLAGRIGEHDLISRHGGDEFLLIAPSAPDADLAIELAQRTLREIGEELHVDGRTLAVSASAGVALYPRDGATLDVLIRAAGNALNEAKKNGSNAFRFFVADMDADAKARMEIEIRLRSAIANRELDVAYQPKVLLASGEICGAEALLRWHNPELGAVAPNVFVPLAEASGQILALDAWVLDAVCARVRAWIDQGLGEVKVSVNLSALQFRQPNLFELIQRALRTHGIPAACIEFEITERALIENTEHAATQLYLLKEIGVGVSLDDFGTGYSSLSYLKNFPIDTLKIDKSFIDDVHLNPNDAAIALTIIALSRNLGMSVVAEGVENRQQCEFLRANGCDAIQGYLFSKPVPHEAFEAMLRERRTLPPCAT